MPFNAHELALLEASDRLVSEPDLRKRTRASRYRSNGRPIGRPRQQLTSDERHKISRLYALGLSPWLVSKVLHIRWRRLLREYPPTNKETNQ
jgi:hypothetical protein